MFVRVKKINGRQYAYLVANEWTPWGSRQRVTKYLGKTHPVEKLSEQTPHLPTGFHQSLNQAIEQELKNHGFVASENHFVNDQGLSVHLTNKTVRNNNKPAVIAMNEGYLCDHTISQLFAFTPANSQNATAKKLANTLLEAGLSLSEEHFVHVFEQATLINNGEKND